MFPHLSGFVSLSDWAAALESVLHLGLPWRMLSSQLATAKTSDGMISYHDWFNELAIKGANIDVRMQDIQYTHTQRCSLNSRSHHKVDYM